MARKTKLDYHVFEEKLENVSDLMKMFTRRTKRVNKIFDDNDDDILVNDKSYGLRLVSMIKTVDAIDDKENEGEKRDDVIEDNIVKALSPVAIVPAAADQISESRSPFKQPSQKRQNVSLRRSLFQQPGTSNIQNVDLICSTPCTINKNPRNFGSSKRDLETISPIKKALSNTVLTDDDLNGFQVMPPEQNKAAVPVGTLQNLEDDLRHQYNIPEQTPNKSYSRSVAAAEKSTKNRGTSPSTVKSTRSEPMLSYCNVVLEPMDMSAINTYRKTQLSRLSTSNRTNINTFNMVETPVTRPKKKSAFNDSMLAKKLALCDSDQQMTDDESETPQKSKDVQKDKSIEVTDDESYPLEPEKHSQTPKRKSHRSQRSQGSELMQMSACVNDDTPENVEVVRVEPFKKPSTIPTAISSNLSASENSIVPAEVIKSFRSLAKPTNETSRMSTASQSLKVVMPKGRSKQINVENKKVQEYLKLQGKAKKKGTKNENNRKRTLYHQRSIIDSDEERAQQPENTQNSNSVSKDNETDDELRTTTESIRKSLEASFASSQPFDQPEIPIDDVPSDRDENCRDNDEQNNTEEHSQETEKLTQESDRSETPEVPEKLAKPRGRPRKNTKVAAPQKKSIKAPKEKEVKDKKENRKRQNSTADVENEPPKKTYRRIANNIESDDEDVDNVSKVTDEGFQSEDDRSVKYDPYKNGCKRPGLRVRKHMRPYWIHSGEDCFITYGVFTKKDMQASALQTKYHIKNSELFKKNPLDIYAAPSSKLDEIKKLVTKRIAVTKSETESKSKRAKVSKKKAQMERIEEEQNDQEMADNESVTTCGTAHTARTHADIVNRIFDNFNELNEAADTSQPASHYTAKEYDLTQINKLIWVTIDAGVHYSPFKEGHFDGFMKFEKGAIKKKAKTKHSVIKMTLLCGKIDILVNQVRLNISNLGFITIKRGQTYSLSNTSDDTAILLLTRLDAQDLET